VKKRYAKMSPRKSNRLRRALFGGKQVSSRKAAKQYGFSSSFRHSRLSWEVEADNRNGPKTVFSTS